MIRMIWTSFFLHIMVLGGFVFINMLGSQAASVTGPEIYHVNLVTMPALSKKQQARLVDGPYKVVSRKEAAAPQKDASMALKRTPNLVTEEPDKGPVTPPSFETDLSGVRLDVKEFEFPYYLAVIQRKIQQHFVVPRMPGIRSLETIIYFRIDRKGRIHNIILEQTSQHPVFDLTAQRALNASNPLPPLPDAYEEDFLGVHFSFEYSP
jgi:hypothetical protein